MIAPFIPLILTARNYANDYPFPSDYRGSFYPPMLLSTLGGGLEVLLIWGFSRKLWSLAIFSFLVGGTAGGYAVLRPRFAAGIVGHDGNKEQSLLIFGILTAMRGVAILASGFIASAGLVEGGSVTGGYGAGKWVRVVVYTGVMMIVASLGALGFFVKPNHRIEKERQFEEKDVGRESGEGERV